MFGFGKNKDKNNKKEALKEDVLEVEIHTMPEKFLPGSDISTGSGSFGGGEPHKLIGLLIIIGAIVVIVVGAAYYLLVIAKKEGQLPVNINEEAAAVAKNANFAGNENANLPAKVEVSRNVNEMVNKNINRSVDLNKNTNENSNINVNANLNINTNINKNVSLGIDAVALLPSSLDTDNDKLTDQEEDLYDTKYIMPDSDSDGFIDGSEVLALYDPNKGGGSRLEDAEAMTKYKDKKFGYQVLYPKSWLIDVDEEGDKVLFSAALGEFMEILVEYNKEALSAQEWYLKQSPGIDIASIESVDIGELKGIRSVDGLNVYIFMKDKIFIISYNVGTLKELNYKTTFEMMVNSFILPEGFRFEETSDLEAEPLEPEPPADLLEEPGIETTPQ